MGDCVEPFGQGRLHHRIFSIFLIVYHGITMNLMDTNSEGNGKRLVDCQQQKKC